MLVNNFRYCHICDKILKKEDNNFESPSKGYYLCFDCEIKYTTSCCECGKKDLKKYLFSVNRSEDRVCESCYQKKYKICNGCHNIFRKKDLVEKYDRFFCERCFEITFVKCHKCKREVVGFKEPIRNGLDNHKYCDKCFCRLYKCII